MRKAPGLFPALLVALFMPLLTAGCASSGRADVNQRVDAVEQNQHALELRVGRVEERLSRIERKENGGTPVGQITQVLPTAPEPAPVPAQGGWREAAPSQVTGAVDILTRENISPQNLSLEQEPAPTPTLAAGQEFPLPLGLASAPELAPAPSLTSAPILAPPPPLQTQTPQAPQRAPRIQPGEKAAYDAALALYKSGKFGHAKDAFQAFQQSFPGSALAPNALYWEGESLYAIELYDQAILVFKAVVNRFPKHDKAASALLKTGYAYERLKDLDNARFFLQILLDDFPKSAPAALARKRMGSW